MAETAEEKINKIFAALTNLYGEDGGGSMEIKTPNKQLVSLLKEAAEENDVIRFEESIGDTHKLQIIGINLTLTII